MTLFDETLSYCKWKPHGRKVTPWKAEKRQRKNSRRTVEKQRKNSEKELYKTLQIQHLKKEKTAQIAHPKKRENWTKLDT